jgi:hypothetical protein
MVRGTAEINTATGADDAEVHVETARELRRLVAM